MQRTPRLCSKAFFDQEIPKEEVTIMSDAPEGQVKIGELVDLGQARPAK